MTDSLMVSLLSNDELDAVCGGAVRSRVRVSVDQSSTGGFVGDFTVSGGYGNNLSNIGNTNNVSTVSTTSVAAVVII